MQLVTKLGQSAAPDFLAELRRVWIDVRYPQCVVPDTFRDVPNVDVDVTATGKLAKDGQFLASEIMAKCPSKYEAQNRQAIGSRRPGSPRSPSARDEGGAGSR